MKTGKHERPRKRNPLRMILLILCGAVLGINLYQANAGKLLGNPLPMPLGFGSAVVLSGSMEPELSKGDLLFITEEEHYRLNDVVVYQDGSILVVHRIIAVNGSTVTTKGDANNAADPEISVEAIKGRVAFAVPVLGSVVEFLKTPVGTVLVILCAVILVELPRRREKQRDEAEREKILAEIRLLKQQQEDNKF